jgi:hypothetical protein
VEDRGKLKTNMADIASNLSDKSNFDSIIRNEDPEVIAEMEVAQNITIKHYNDSKTKTLNWLSPMILY